MRGEKGELHADPEDPPRKRANKQRGHGTYENDRPPIVGTVGRESGQVRLRVVHNTDRKTLEAQVHRFTLKETTCYTEEWQSYNHIIRERSTVCHADHEWAGDDDGDGVRMEPIFEVVLVDASEQPMERPEKVKKSILEAKNGITPTSAHNCRSKDRQNNCHRLYSWKPA